MGSMNLDNVKAVVPIHGGLTPLRAVQTDSVTPYVMILSGGVDDAHGNTTELELHLDAANATWEISRYSNAQHGFTGWSSPAYQPMADSRSWMSTMSLFETMVADATTGDSSSSDEAMESGSAEMMDTGDAKEDLSHDEDEEGEHQISHDEEKEDGEVHDHSTHDHMSDYKNAMGDESEMSDESELSSADRRSSFGVVVVSMAAALFAALVAV